VAILGPTSAGKSELGLALARAVGGEILCCDSVQVYRGLDIGSGKATAAERAEIPHHLLDLVDPDEHFHAAAWGMKARVLLPEIRWRGHVPIVVGGTGLYFRSLVRGLFDAPAPDGEIRRRHQEYVAKHGVPMLHRRLAKVDPESAAAIHRTDYVRISRALEIFEQTGTPIGVLRRTTRPPEPLDLFTIVVDPPMPELRPRIEARVDAMLEAGFADEVRGLVRQGYARARALRSIGYAQMLLFTQGQLGLQDAVGAIKRLTVQYARRQKTWFRKEKPRLRLAQRPDPVALAAEISAWMQARRAV
jgi:tRNA dimethylallyltransferase